MARLVDCYPYSDDELPSLDALVGRIGTSRTKSTKSYAPSPEKSLILKDASKSSTRKVRRLGGACQKTSSNPLFQRWNSETPGSSRSSSQEPSKVPRSRVANVNRGTKNETPTTPTSQSDNEKEEEEEEEEEEEDDDDDDEPQLRIRSTRTRRPVVISDSEDDENESSESEDEPSHERIKKLQMANRKEITTPSGDTGLDNKRSAENESEESEEDEEDAIQRQLMEESRRLPSSSESESEDDDSQDLETHEDETSAFKTAAEDSEEEEDYTEESESYFEPDDSPKPTSKKLPGKLLFDRPTKTIPTSKLESLMKDIPSLHPTGSRGIGKENRASHKEVALAPSPKVDKTISKYDEPPHQNKKGTAGRVAGPKSTAADLANSLAKLRLQLQDFSEEEKSTPDDSFTTPPATPPKSTKTKGLASPSKRGLIPKTPHRPSMEAFWDQDTVNDWNDEHSPRKLMLPPISKGAAKTTVKKDPKKESKKSFTSRKHAVAEAFLQELDAQITQGKIAELAASTGGVKLVWTKTLNTTAGRANWRRETIRTKQPDGTQVDIQYKHHASIELAEKVIDDEHRLLNVLAHEFCHLANFMVTGITTNPHGKEFKAWAAKCSIAFGDRGIEVTTKHTYEIDFKFVWECTECGLEFKRHSRSIDPQRHRCGSCKNVLRQTKPVPRKNNAGGSAGTGTMTGVGATTTTRQPSRYQVFVKEQMRIVKEENPGSPQKDLMRLIADKWAKERDAIKAREASMVSEQSKPGVDDAMAGKMIDLTLEAET